MNPLTLSFCCIHCGSKEFIVKKYFTARLGADPDKHKVIKCKVCHLHSLFPIPDEEEIKHIYSHYAYQGDRKKVEIQRCKTVYPNKIELINTFSPDAKTVLDVGAGLGGFVSVSAKNGYDTVGLEMEEEQITIGKELFNVNLVNSTIEEFIMTANKKFDVVHMHHVLEHFRDPVNILNQLKKILNSNSIVIIEVPNQFFQYPQEIYYRIGYSRPVIPYNPYHHLYFYSPEVLREIFKKLGYSILYFSDQQKIGKRNIKKWIKVNLSRRIGWSTSPVLEAVISPRT